MICSTWRRGRGHLIAVYSFLSRGSRGTGTDLFSLVTSDSTQRSSMNLHQGTFRLGMRKRFLTQRLVGHCNSLPREAATALNLPKYKKHLDRALKNMI